MFCGFAMQNLHMLCHFQLEILSDRQCLFQKDKCVSVLNTKHFIQKNQSLGYTKLFCKESFKISPQLRSLNLSSTLWNLKKVLVSGTENKINQKENTNEQTKNRS